MERCRMQTFTEDVGQIVLDQNRYNGCGLCVSTYSAGALSLVCKPESEQTQIPATMDDMWRVISQEQVKTITR